MDNSINFLTIGRVIDTNDPQQMGRVRAFCSGLGDQDNYKVEDIPWAVYITPLSGITSFGTRGPEDDESQGPVAYGMWNVPKIGAYVLVGCIDGQPSMRYFVGCVPPQYMTHTLPHGRHIWGDDKYGLPDGPVDSLENPIEPLYRKQTEQFTKQGDLHASGTPSDPRKNMEWRTRGADYQASAITNLVVEHPLDSPGSSVADHEWGSFETITQEDGSTRTIKGIGYSVDQLEPDDNYPSTGGVNYDSQVYSWNSPGFHSISMDDRSENCRIRIRTTTGHQVILDDTNERIYVSTSGGNSWVEMDNVGNIDFYGRNISFHSTGDFNLFSDKTLRLQAKEGIHIQSGSELRLHSVQDLHIKSDTNIRSFATQSIFMESSSQMHLKTGTLYLAASADLHSKAGGTGYFSGNTVHINAAGSGFFSGSSVDINASSTGSFSGSTLNLVSSGDNFVSAGGSVHLAGSVIRYTSFSPGASSGSSAAASSPASAATAANEKNAFWTSRVPEHEPWARVFMKKTADQDDSNSHDPEYPYSSTEVGRGSSERGESYTRNDKWKR